MKLQLSLAALERLLGGDTEMEAELRQQVVQNFSKRYIKEIVNSDAIGRTLKELREVVTQEIKTLVPATADRHMVKNAKNDIRSQIHSLVDEVVGELVNEAIKRKIEDRIEKSDSYWVRYINDRITATVNKTIDQRVQEEVQRRLKIAAEVK